MRIIVHGGAGSAPERPEERQTVLDRAANRGTEAGDPTEAVCAAVGVLESEPAFNAGVGSAIQSDGYARTDAGLMTDDLEIGAVCSMPGVERAVEVARIVKEETPHVLVSGVHAVDLADAFGIETGVDLDSEKTRRRWSELDAEPPAATDDLRAHVEWVNERFGADGTGPADDDPEPGDGHDTVGAVATDGETIAAATSSGGRWLALAGRVGDVPQVGSGFYCSRAGGASTTGTGEDIARTTLSRRAVDLLEDGLDASSAAEAAIEEFGETTDGVAGIILLDPDGDAGAAYNSEAMATSRAGEV